MFSAAMIEAFPLEKQPDISLKVIVLLEGEGAEGGGGR